MQVGELANGFTDEFKTDVDFPFKEIRGMRNFLAHNYIKADTSIVWNTSKTDIPSLLTKCTSLIEQTKDEEIKNLEDDSDSEDVSNIGL